MEKLYCCFLLLAISYLVNSGFEEDLAIASKLHSCQPSCTFNYSEVTSKTVEFYPNCGQVCAILTFNENTDLDEVELKKVFENTWEIFGGVRVVNSNLTSLSFFTPATSWWLDCEPVGLVIENNPRLTDVTFLDKFSVWRNDKTMPCIYRVRNNPILDGSEICEKNGRGFEVEVTGNLKDCGCRGDRISDETLATYENCTDLFWGLQLKNLTAVEIPFLSNVVTINGDIEITNTLFTDLSFFENLKRIWFEPLDNKRRIYMDIHDNERMTSLGWAMDYQDGIGKIKNFNIQNVNVRFCVTIKEMEYFLRRSVSFKNLEARFCDYNGEKLDFKLCIFKNLKSLDSGCVGVLGGVTVKSGDEEFVDKFKNLIYIFGSLTLKGTKLISLPDVFPSLQYIASLNQFSPVISLIGNRYLRNGKLKTVKNIITRNKRTVLLHDNPLLIGENKSCSKRILRDGYLVKSKFIGGDCDENYIYTTPIPLYVNKTDLPHFDSWNPELYPMYHPFAMTLTIIYLAAFIANIFHLSIIRKFPVYRFLMIFCVFDLLQAVSGFVLFSPFWIRSAIPECYLTREKSDATIVLYVFIIFRAIHRSSIWIFLSQKMSWKILIPVILNSARSWFETFGFEFQKVNVEINCNKEEVYLSKIRYHIITSSESIVIKAIGVFLDFVPYFLMPFLIVELFNNRKVAEKKSDDKTPCFDVKLMMDMAVFILILELPMQLLKVISWESDLTFYRRIFEISMIFTSLRAAFMIVVFLLFSSDYQQEFLEIYDFTNYKFEVSNDHTMVITN